nr:MAG TPA: hypothetical protein [Caudoviricetes sp.]
MNFLIDNVLYRYYTLVTKFKTFELERRKQI